MNVIEVNIPLRADGFWNALKIYYQHPNSINKQVLFSEHFFVFEFQTCLTLNECQELFNNFCVKLSEKCTAEICSECNIKQINDLEEAFLLPNRMYLLIRKLIPKLNVSDNFEFFEFIFFDKISTKVFIFTKRVIKTSNKSDKIIQQDALAVLKFNFLGLKCNDEGLQISYNNDLSEKGVTWLQATFVPKLKKLILNVDLCKGKNKNLSKLPFDNKVDIVQYYKFYERMKSKYAKYFVENWTEKTDPKKFVYEDIGIATYLLMVWNGGNIPEEGSKKQKFIDLGCGNGLLVHLLNSEGHLGVGLDLRKRKIWDIYPPTTVLKVQEEIIIPTSTTTYPEADWLIGNHSDELTAWIPIMARLSNNHCQFFVLPCCPYQLNGMKFQRKNSSSSSYQDFINYVKQKSDLCKFETYIDKLRIPSTKRICLIGLSKPEISVENYTSLKEDIIKYVEQECQPFDQGQNNNNKLENKASLNFKVRDLVEPVRNCTKLPVEFIDNVIKSIMIELLKGQNICTTIKDGKTFFWNRGRKVSIGELASSLNKKILQQLKNECKGLQTLLKNHHFLFEVAQGFVQFRSPESMLKLSNKFLETQGEAKWKVRKCWFFYNHPDKCPLDDDVCSYSHNKKNTL